MKYLVKYFDAEGRRNRKTVEAETVPTSTPGCGIYEYQVLAESDWEQEEAQERDDDHYAYLAEEY